MMMTGRDHEMEMEMNAATRIAVALTENAAIAIDHETRAFVGFRFKIAADPRETVVRVHRKSAEFAALSARAAS